MKRIFFIVALLGVFAVDGGAAVAQCRNGSCRAVPMRAAAPAFAFEPHATCPVTLGLYWGNEQVAALDLSTGAVAPIDRETGEFIDLGAGKVGQLGGEEIPAPGPQGSDRRGILKQGERYTVNGERSTEKEVRRLIGKGGAVPDDSASPSLTLIGSDEECKAVLAAIAGDATAAQLSSQWLVQSFRPGNPLVAGSGFVLDGKPSIYGQLPDGRTLFRASGVVDIGELVGAMVRGIEVAEGKRAPDPAYNPQADAGLVVKPQVDATVQTPPWIYAVTHMAALLVGGLGALGGRWALVAMLLTPAMQALEDRMLARMQPQPPTASVAPPAAIPPK